MDTFIVIESIILLLLSGFAGSPSSRMSSIFDRSPQLLMWAILICLMLLLFGLVLKVIYYQIHQWPIGLCSSTDTFDIEKMLALQESNLTNFDETNVEGKDVFVERNELGHKKDANATKMISGTHLEEKVEPGRQNNFKSDTSNNLQYKGYST